MAGKPTELEVLIKTTGTEKLRGLTSSLKKLKDTTTITATSTGKLTDSQILIVNLQEMQILQVKSLKRQQQKQQDLRVN